MMTQRPTPSLPPAPAVRDGWRDGSAAGGDPQDCPVCAAPLPSTRARYCSAACRQRAFRLRHLRRLDPAAGDVSRVRHDLRRRGVLVAHTVYECPRCADRIVGAQRCPECHVFCRALGPGGQCPDCDLPILLAELLGMEVLP